MRRLLAFSVAVLAFTACAFAQGVPASVTSQSWGRFHHGNAGFVGRGFGGKVFVGHGGFRGKVFFGDPFFGRGRFFGRKFPGKFFHPRFRNRGFFHPGFLGPGFGGGGVIWTGVPYPVPYGYIGGAPVYLPYTDEGVELGPEERAAMEAAAEEEEPPAYTVFERRSRVSPEVAQDMARGRPRTERGDEREAEAQEREPRAPERAAAPPPDQPPTVLVFRNGTTLEVRNYAIQGGTLFNLSGPGPRRIQVAELDVPATVRMNDQRGVLFVMPGDKR